MVLYNVTVNIDKEIEFEWLNWMKTHHIPAVLATGRFSENKFFRLVSPVEEQGGTTYAIQYFAPSMKELDQYLEFDAPRLIEEHVRNFKDRFVAFRTVLEEVQ